MSTPSIVEIDALDPQLVDMISEAMVWSSNAIERADVLQGIVVCAVDALRWRLQPDGDQNEESSAQQVLQAADQHLGRMQTGT